MIRYHRGSYDAYLMMPRPAIDDSFPSNTNLWPLNRLMSEDQKAGEAIWALYKTQKKLITSCNAFEELITFRMKHFVLTKRDQEEMQLGMLSLTMARRFLRGLGPAVVKGHHPWYALREDVHRRS